MILLDLTEVGVLLDHNNTLPATASMQQCATIWNSTVIKGEARMHATAPIADIVQSELRQWPKPDNVNESQVAWVQ